MGSSRVTVSQLLGRVWLVLAYSAVFEFPLTTAEVLKRCWRFEGETVPTQPQIEKVLRLLRSLGKVSLTKELWHLVFQPQAPSNRLHWERYSQQKIEQATPVIKFLTSLPWVVGVAITGSVAVNSAKKDDDVDFMVVTEPNRLWLTRLLTLFFAMKYGKRRSFAREEPNSWCFNLWLDSDNLLVPQAQHTLYTAYEVCQAKWVTNRRKTAEKFLKENTWVKPILLEYYEQRKKQINRLAQLENRLSSIRYITNPILTIINWVSYLLQLIYMMPHKTNERVKLGFAWFHPKEMGSKHEK